MKNKSIILCLLLNHIIFYTFPANISAVTIDFEDLPFGMVYLVGDHFMPSGIDAYVDGFFPIIPPPIYNGSVGISNSCSAGGMGKELTISNANIEFIFPKRVQNLNLLFGEYGGDINFGINNDLRKAANFHDLTPIIGDANVYVTGGTLGTISVSGGCIKTFTIGGQQLYIDEIQVNILYGDLNNDCNVDFEDMNILTNQWLQMPGDPSADIAQIPDGDGFVDFYDFVILANDWLK